MIVHLVGKGPGFKEAPDPSPNGEYQVWGCNDVPIWRQVDVLFNMHDLAHVTEQEKIVAIMCEQNFIPLYSIKKYDWLSNSVEYPLDDIVAEFEAPYFSDSLCYMIAMAIYSGATLIHTWGMNLHCITRDFRERFCVEFWLGMAMGRGVEIGIHGESALLKTNELNQMYGYDCYFHYDNDPQKKRQWGLGGVPKEKQPKGELL